MMAVVKSGEAASRRNLRTQLVLERITGRTESNTFTSSAMQQGIDREVDAQAAYERLTGSPLVRTGFLRHDELMAGASLDGHVGDFDSIIEIKCPLAATHLSYLRTGEVPWNYAVQVTHALWLTGAESCDWFSYNPDFPPALQIKMVRVWRDDGLVQNYEQRVRQFLAEVDAEEMEVRGMLAA